MLLRDSQRAADGGIAAVAVTWNGLGKVGAKSRICSMTLVMPNGISARYQGKAYVSTCGEWMCFYTSN